VIAAATSGHMQSGALLRQTNQVNVPGLPATA